MNRNIALSLMSTALAVAVPAAASAQSATDPFDNGRGGTIFPASVTEESFFPVAMIDGRPFATIFRDANGPAGTRDFAQINAAFVPFVIRGVELYTLADGAVEDGVRGTSNFRLLGDTTIGPGDPPLDIVLVDGVNPRDDGTVNRYLFAPVVLYRVYAEFTRSTDAGSRVVELDAIPVPEPGPAALLLTTGALLALKRRRPAHHEPPAL